jgi:hypothetical protein
VENSAQLENDFIGHVGKEGDTKDRHLKDAKDGGVEDFPPMEAERGGDVHIRINVVDVVKTPKQGIFMINLMPVIKGPIKEEEAENQLEPTG